MSLKPIAFYLPQFHPIPENDRWWGEGFTEWTNVKKAKPLFKGHRQPKRPGELGYYDLRNTDVQIKQAQLAKTYGIHGFCYWHYWFGNGKRLLDQPAKQLLENKQIDFPFCFGWANESWSGIWHGAPDKILMEQKYPGVEDYKKHFYYLLPFFTDERYIKINNKPFFLVYKPASVPNLHQFSELFNELAISNGFNGIHFVATNVSEGWEPEQYHFQAVVPPYHNRIAWMKKRWIGKIGKKVNAFIKGKEKMPEHVYPYKEAMKYFLPDRQIKDKFYPLIVPNWDNSPRSGRQGVIFTGSTPELFKKHVNEAANYVKMNSSHHQILMIKSWNEWAEGNYLEPDATWGRKYLELFKEVVDNF